MNQTGLDARPSTKRELGTFAAYGVSFISLGLSMAVLGPMLPYLADHLSVSFGQISFLFTANNLGYLIGSSGGGRLFDRFDSHKIMILSLALMVAMGILIPLVSRFVLMLVVMFFFGLGQGALDVGANVNVLWLFQKRVGPYMNALHFFFGLGAFLSPILVTQVMNLAGGALTWPFWAITFLFLPGLIVLFFFPSPQNPEKAAPSEATQKSSLPLIILMIVLFFLYVGTEIGFGGWIFTYALEAGVANETMASFMNSFFWGALTLGRLISIPLARKLRPSRLLIGNFAGMVLFFVVILIWPDAPAAIWIGSAGLGLAMSSVFPTLLSLGESRLKITGTVTGLFYLGGSLGSTLIPMLLGQIFDYVGSYQVMLTLFGLSVLGLIVLAALLLSSKRLGEKERSPSI